MKKKGFTLIELLAVIIILAIIGLITYPIVTKVINDSREKAYNENINMLEHAANLYLVNEGGSYSTTKQELQFSELMNKGYIEELPFNPKTNELLKGCLLYSWVNNNYQIEYSENCGNVVAEYTDNSGANKPELLTNMIPVKYNGTNWIYADVTEEWYDYDSKEWANAVILNNGVTKDVNDIVLESEIALWYVWIPRYTYTIFNNTGKDGLGPRPIVIDFEEGTASSGTVKCEDVDFNSNPTSEVSETCTDSTNGSVTDNVSTYTHPAFTFGTQELTGIWVGKFENSATEADISSCTNSNYTACNTSNLTVKIGPNLDSWRFITVSNMNTAIKNVNITDGDSHMIKNMEWGAVAYLSNSIYGRCTGSICEEITMNNVIKNITTWNSQTGCAANDEDTVVSSTCQNTYESTGGVKASTTGNIYGVYDMSGGAWEYVMGNMVDSTGAFYSSGSGFTAIPDSKYYDKYSYDASDNKTHGRGKLGDATRETLTTFGNDVDGWNDDYTFLPHSSESWLSRGSFWASEIEAGIFSFANTNGGPIFDHSSRSVLTRK